MSGEMEQFGTCLGDADLARVALVRERLAFEKESLAMESKEREEARKKLSNGRKAQQKLELENFKLMRDSFQRM